MKYETYNLWKNKKCKIITINLKYIDDHPEIYEFNKSHLESRNNPTKNGRESTVFWDIPFVKDWLAL